MYMALRVIKQGGEEKVEVYYESILKLANCLQHQVDDNLITTFFRACLQPYFQIATTGMKKDTLFKHKEVIITCEEIIRNANEYHKLFKPPTKQKKTSKGKRIDVIYGQCNKSKHSKELCHWNPNNPNKKLKDKKEV